MKHIYTSIVIICLGCPAQAQDIYGANSCFDQMNPDARMSDEIINSFTSLNKGGWLMNIAHFDLALAVIQHRKKQCDLKNSGQSYESSCPVGDTILIDDVAQAAIQSHGSKSSAAIQNIAKTKGEELRSSGRSMVKACK